MTAQSAWFDGLDFGTAESCMNIFDQAFLLEGLAQMSAPSRASEKAQADSEGRINRKH